MIARARALIGAAAVLLMVPGALAGRIHGNAPIGVVLPSDGVPVRHDAAGIPGRIHLSKSMEQLRSVRPSASRDYRVIPNWRKNPPRGFATGSLEPAGIQPSSSGSSGATWIVLRIPRSNPGGTGGSAVWELHTNGLRTPGVSIAALPGS